MLPRLEKLLGVENSLDDVARAIKLTIQDELPTTVGAMLLTCSDESEYECSDAFRHVFATPMLPRLKYGARVPFRVANLGARYEWSAVALTDNHFTTPESRSGFKYLVIKVNSHVSKDKDLRYGEMERYELPSYYCGALRALLDGVPSPAVAALEEAFASEGMDRLTILREKVEDAHRPLAAAIVNARIQARMAFMEIQELQPTVPTVFLVPACVTLNGPDRDTELLVGFYLADRRGESSDAYFGLSDDPSKYAIDHRDTTLMVSEGAPVERRAPRRHREVVRRTAPEPPPPPPAAIEHARKGASDHSVAKPALKLALAALAGMGAVPSALLLFGEGLVGLHHVWRAHHLTRNPDDERTAETILSEFERRIETLPPEQAQQLARRMATLGER
jgi:hypothetical protein